MNNQIYIDRNGTIGELSDDIRVYNDSNELKGYLYFSRNI